MAGKSSHTLKTGRQAETLACDFLANRGYEIVRRNFRYGRGEIDIIASKDNLLVFVEVKFRSTARFGHPESFVTEGQAERIMATAEEFVHEDGWNGQIRFDIISVEGASSNPDQWKVVHLPDAIV